MSLIVQWIREYWDFDWKGNGTMKWKFDQLVEISKVIHFEFFLWFSHIFFLSRLMTQNKAYLFPTFTDLENPPFALLFLCACVAATDPVRRYLLLLYALSYSRICTCSYCQTHRLLVRRFLSATTVMRKCASFVWIKESFAMDVIGSQYVL